MRTKLLCYLFLFGLALDPCPGVYAHTFDQMVEKIDIRPLFDKGLRGQGAVALFDVGFNLDQASEGHGNVVVLQRQQGRGAVVASILAGEDLEGQRVSISPGVSIMPYIFNSLPHEEEIEQSQFLADLLRAYQSGVRLVQLGAGNMDVRTLLRLQRDGTGDWMKEMIFVVRSGETYHKTESDPVFSDENEGLLNDQGLPAFENIVIVVGVNENDALKERNRKCGGARAFCVAVPSSGYSTQATPIVTGALALLMEAAPGLPARQYLDALFTTSIRGENPDDSTGRGIIQVNQALTKLTQDLNSHRPSSNSSWPRLQSLREMFQWLFSKLPSLSFRQCLNPAGQ